MAGTHGQGTAHGHGGHGHGSHGAAVAERSEPAYELSEAERREIARKAAERVERERLRGLRAAEEGGARKLGSEIKHLAHEIDVIETRLKQSLAGSLWLHESPEEIAKKSAEDEIEREDKERAAKHLNELSREEKEKIRAEWRGKIPKIRKNLGSIRTTLTAKEPGGGFWGSFFKWLMRIPILGGNTYYFEKKSVLGKIPVVSPVIRFLLGAWGKLPFNIAFWVGGGTYYMEKGEYNKEDAEKMYKELDESLKQKQEIFKKKMEEYEEARKRFGMPELELHHH